METSLRFDSGKKHLKLFAKEKFSNDDNYVLTVRVPRAPSGRERPNPTLEPAKRPRGEVSPSDISSLERKKEAAQSRSSKKGFSFQTRDERVKRVIDSRLTRFALSICCLYVSSSPLAAVPSDAHSIIYKRKKGFGFAGHEGWSRGEPRVRA